MIRLILSLLIALLASAGGNLFQWRAAAVAKSEHRAEIKAAVERGRLEAAELAASRNAGLALRRAQDDLVLLRLRLAVDQRQTDARVVYRDRIQRVEVPVCLADQEQVAAVNEVLR